MFWQNKKNSIFCECLSILDILGKWLSPRVKESKRVVDSGFHIVDSGFRGLDSGFHAYGFRIPNFLRFQIPKLLTLAFIRSSEANILQFEYEVVNLNRRFICSPKDKVYFNFRKHVLMLMQLYNRLPVF